MKQSGSTLEELIISQAKALGTMISRVDEEWRELKEVLLAEIHQAELEEEPSSQACITCLTEAGKPEAAEAKEAPASSPRPPQQAKFAVTPLEAEAILKHVEKFNQDNQILERIEKLTRQNRRLSILGSIFCILTFLFMMHLFEGDGLNLRRMAQSLIATAFSKEVRPSAALTATPKPLKTPAPAPGNVASLASGESLPAAGAPKAQETSPASASREPSALVGTPQTPETPDSKYVGSITSNKYHYPDCKWAKTILPGKVRGFASVAEAKKAGYIQCPTCRPPLADNANLPASEAN